MDQPTRRTSPTKKDWKERAKEFKDLWLAAQSEADNYHTLYVREKFEKNKLESTLNTMFQLCEKAEAELRECLDIIYS